jgi:hypothetical protein
MTVVVAFFALLVTALIAIVPSPVTADLIFFDDTFDLADYTVDTYQSGGAVISTSQTSTEGGIVNCCGLRATQAPPTAPSHPSGPACRSLR